MSLPEVYLEGCPVCPLSNINIYIDFGPKCATIRLVHIPEVVIELQVSGWAIGCFQRFVCSGGKVAKPAATIWTNLSKLIVLVAELILWN